MTDATNLTLTLVVGVLFAAGVYLLTERALLRVVLGFVLLGHGANLALLVSGGPAGPAPISGQVTAEEASDPLVQAMALTAVVITFGATALLLALAHRSMVLAGDDEVQDDRADRAVARPVPGSDVGGEPVPWPDEDDDEDGGYDRAGRGGGPVPDGTEEG